ncbi:Wall-associated receptor kinase-like 14 [Striga hermonthica]|uniref:Wall-associated receptor kinase-like 14 n=1 Tax=Striga hermonthica TaxID=68872 RepID=A0A9N7NKC1_STRHE|nr:Wall-associated receptor kinase-like 14 [Striga hermonthica]
MNLKILATLFESTAAAVGAFLMVMLGLIVCLVRNKSKLATRSRRVARRNPHETSGITIPIYPYTEIEKATDFFSEKRRLGCGGYGTVYSGRINDEWVAVKRIQRRDPSCTEQVLNEIRLISSVSHPNLVRLLGCSLDRDDEHALVYEFMSNGTLAEHLRAGSDRAPLPWPVRLTIAAETASAVAHLHGAGPRPIYHRDIKSSNILLDARFGSKVADFGLSRPGPGEFSSSHVSTTPQGTPGYVDPQYHTSFRMSDRSDVYSFGVVLAEIITGMQAVDLDRPMEEANLATLAADKIGKGRLDVILDPTLKEEMSAAEDGGAWARESMRRVAELAFRCLAWNGEARPPMGEVAKELEGIRVSRWIASHAIPTPTARLSLSSDTSERPLNSTAGDEDGGADFPPPTRYSPPRLHTVSNRYGNHTGMVRQLPRFKTELKSLAPFARNGVALRVGSHKKLGFRVDASKWPEPFKGKPGYVSFGGLSHRSIEESRLVSAPFKEENGSFLWVLAPAVLISALIVPQFFMFTAIENAFRNEVFAEILSIFSCEAMFYAGVAVFLFITERVQKPYLEFSPRRWNLITGLRGYLISSVFIMGLKVFAPILAVYVTWPVLGFPALVSVAPFLTSCLAQYLFEKHLKRNGSSCWPILPIVFENA